ncbi:MAG: GNAT family N-acetyltransferase, partial [Caulobacteraceae bacterium]
MSFPARETSRLILRAIVPEDWRSIHRYMSDLLVTTWLPEGLFDEDRSRAFANRNSGDEAEAVAV